MQDILENNQKVSVAMAKMLEIEPFLANIQVYLANYEKVD
jgi:hypothetical protein